MIVCLCFQETLHRDFHGCSRKMDNLGSDDDELRMVRIEYNGDKVVGNNRKKDQNDEMMVI